MAKVFQFLIILCGLSLLLGLMGLETAAGSLLRAFGYNPTSWPIQDSQLWFYFAGIWGITIVGSIIYGVFTRNSADSTIRAGLVAFLATFALDFISIMNYFRTYGDVELQFLSWLVSLVYVPMVLGYLISLIMFWGGNDI